MPRYRKPAPARYGTHPVHLFFAAGSNPLTANTTTVFRLPTPPGKFVFSRFSAYCDTVAADADGAITATVRRYDSAADQEVTMSGSINLEALTTKERTVAVASASATENQLVVLPGDTINVAVVSDSAAIDTQPTALCFAVELFQLD